MTHHPLLDTLDIDILMHKESHFSGSFEVMISYYKKKGVGVMPDFSLKRIKELQMLEEQMGTNLAEEMIPDAGKEDVTKAKAMYLDLRRAYEEAGSTAKLIAELILSEEETPKAEIKSLVHTGKDAVEALIQIVATTSLYDPLYPGYGRAPIFAAECLGKIGDEKAIIPLFEALHQSNFFTDEAMISALAKIGDKAKEFLLKALQKEPFSKDNEKAALTLMNFEESPSLGKICLALLEKPELQKKQTFATYLLNGCLGLNQSEDITHLEKLSHHLPKSLLDESQLILGVLKRRRV